MKPFFNKVLLAFLSTALALGVGEYLVRAWFRFPDLSLNRGLFQSDELLGWSLTPNFSGTLAKQEFSQDIMTNSQGLRDVEYGPKKVNEFRILALGDSFTWGGYGADLSQTFVKILEKQLNEHSQRVEYQVINAGVPAYVTEQELLYLRQLGMEFEPDLLLFTFNVGGDFFPRADLAVKDGILVSKKEKLSDALQTGRLWIYESSFLYRIVDHFFLTFVGSAIRREALRIFWNEDSHVQLYRIPQESRGMFYARTLELLSQMNEFAASKKVPFVVVLFPAEYQVDAELRSSFINQHFLKRDTYDLEFPQKMIKQWGEERRVQVIDLEPDLATENRGNQLFWKFNPHLTVYGNQVVGSTIFRELSEKIGHTVFPFSAK